MVYKYPGFIIGMYLCVYYRVVNKKKSSNNFSIEMLVVFNTNLVCLMCITYIDICTLR